MSSETDSTISPSKDEDDGFTRQLNALTVLGDTSRDSAIQELNCYLDSVSDIIQEIRSKYLSEIQLNSTRFHEVMASISGVDEAKKETLMQHLEICFRNGHWVQLLCNHKALQVIQLNLKEMTQLKFHLKKVEDLIASHLSMTSEERLPEKDQEDSFTLIDPFLVTVTHIKSPGEFYVIRQCDETKRSQLMNELKEAAQAASVPEEIHNGQMYAVENCGKIWVRGVCLSVCGHVQMGEGPSEALYEVFLPDQGHNERIATSMFRVLPNSLIDTPPLAIECTLNQAFPVQMWPTQASLLFKQLTRRGPLNMKVFSQEGNILNVDLAQIPCFADEGHVVSIRDALFFSRRAPVPVPAPRTPVTQLGPAVRNREIPAHVEMEYFKGSLSYINASLNMYIQVRIDSDSELAEKYRLMEVLLQQTYNDPGAELTKTVYSPVKGEFYAAPYKSVWYRTIAEDVYQDGLISLHFVDTGHRLKVESKHLRQLPDEFLALPSQAIRCKLDGVCSLHQQNSCYSKIGKKPVAHLATKKFFHKYLNKVVDVFVQSASTSSYFRKELTASCLIFLENDPVSLNSSFVERGVGLCNAICMEKIVNFEKSRAASLLAAGTTEASGEDLMTFSAGTSVATSPDAHQPNVFDYEVKPEAVESDTKEELCETKFIQQPTCSEGVVASALELVVEAVPVDNQNFAAQVATKNCYIDDGSSPKKVDENFNVISLGPEDFSPYPSVLAKQDQVVSFTGTMPESDEFVAEVLFIHCNSPESIFFSTAGNMEKLKVLKEQMKAYYETYQMSKPLRFEVNFACVVNYLGGFHRAEVVDIDNYPDCQVQLMDMGHRVPMPASQIYPLVAPFDCVPRLAVQCSIHQVFPRCGSWSFYVQKRVTELMMGADKIFICKRAVLKSQSALSVMVVYKVFSEGGPLEVPGYHMVNLNQKLVELRLAVDKPEAALVPLSANGWKQPVEGNLLRQFNGCVTWVNIDGEIFLYDVNKSERQLAIIQEELDRIFQQSEPTEADLEVEPGDPCIAKYHIDGSWYRAQVIGPSKRINFVVVYFVDYGTRDEVDYRHIRKNIQIKDVVGVPIQTIRCTLNNIKVPGSNSNQPAAEWPIETLNYLHQYVVEKRCRVSVHCQTPLKVSLTLPTGTDVAKHLVDKSMAEYVQVKSVKSKLKKKK